MASIEESLDQLIDNVRRRYAGAKLEKKTKMGPLTVENLCRLATELALQNGETTLATLLSQDSSSNSTIKIRQVPSLYSVALLESRITSKIMAALATRPVVSIFDLEEEITVMEGVPRFSDLLMGTSLSEWPLVQSNFRCKSLAVFPVRSSTFIHFLAHHADAEQLRRGVGDTRDAVNAFRHYFETEVLPYCPRRGGYYGKDNHGKNEPLQSNFSVGIYIRNYAELLAVVRQEEGLADSQLARLSRGVQSKKINFSANKTFYEKVVGALDTALHAVEESGNMQSCAVPFTVNCTLDEMQEWHIPRPCRASLLENAHRYPQTGLRIAFRMGAEGTLKRTTEPSVGAVPKPLSAASSSPIQESSLSPAAAHPAGKSHARRAKRGVVVSDDGGQVVVPPNPHSSPDEGEALRNAICRIECSNSIHGGLSPVPSSSDGKYISKEESSTTFQRTRSCADIIQAMERMIAGHDVDDDAVSDLLAELTPGDRIPPSLVYSLLIKISARSANSLSEVWNNSRETPYFPLFDVDPLASTDSPMRVKEIAAPFTISWSAASAAATTLFQSEGSVAISDLFGRVLEASWPPRLKPFLVGPASVPEFPTVSSWLFGCEALKRSSWLPTQEGEKQCWELLMRYIKEDFTQRIILTSSMGLAACTSIERLASTVLDDMSASILEETPMMYIFPLEGRWCRGMDGLYCCGPTYYGVRGMYMRRWHDPGQEVALVNGDPSSLLLKCHCFDSNIHFVHEQVLERMGVKNVATHVTTFVSMEFPFYRGTFNEESFQVTAGLHHRVAAVADCVQTYLQCCQPILYAVSHSTIRSRLAKLRVVTGYQLQTREQLFDPRTGDCYVMSQSPHLRFVAQHGVLYSEMESFTSNVIAEALADLFLPFTPSLAVRVELVQIMQRILSRVTDASGDVIPAIIPSVVDEEKSRILSSYSPNQVEKALLQRIPKLVEGDDLPWEVAVLPKRGHKQNFPPGVDGLAVPLHLSFVHPTSKEQCNDRGPGRPPHSHFNRSRLTYPQEWFNTDNIVTLHNPLDVVERALEESEEGAEFVSRSSADPSALLELVKQEDLYDAKEKANDDDIIRFVGRKRPRDVPLGQATEVALANESDSTRRYALAAERHVYTRLCEEYKKDPEVRVIWLNESREQGEPYDIVVTAKRRGSSRPNILHFVEVKSTSSDSKHHFELSLNELLFAARYASCYHIYRVYGASTNELRRMRIKQYVDVIGLWRSGKLTISGDISVVPRIS